MRCSKCTSFLDIAHALVQIQNNDFPLPSQKPPLDAAQRLNNGRICSPIPEAPHINASGSFLSLELSEVNLYLGLFTGASG
jgi:hypothetical protein